MAERQYVGKLYTKLGRARYGKQFVKSSGRVPVGWPAVCDRKYGTRWGTLSEARENGGCW
jgi:hypothetical protein